MLQSWFIASVIAGILSNSFNTLSRYTLQETDDATIFAWFFEGIRVIFFVIFGVITNTLVFDLTGYEYSLLILIGLIEVASIFILMKMHQYAHLSVSTIIQRSRSIWIAIIAFFVFGEVLKLYEYAGILLIFFALALVAPIKRLTIDKGIKIAFLSAFVTAWISILLKLATTSASTAVIMIFMGTPSVIILPFMMKSFPKRARNLVRGKLGLQTLASLLSATGTIAYVYALSVGSASKVSSVYQSMMFVSIIIGITFLGEKDRLGRKIFGTVATIGGIVLLAFS